ncbi:MAG: glycine cleavage system aminomethyltransferase GcvT [Leptospirales bacterium]
MILPLHSSHLREGGHMVDFHGYDLPIRFSTILAETAEVRARSGLFDVSHMGHFEIRGSGAVSSVNRLLTSNLEAVDSGKALYGHLLDESGGVIDDIMAYRFGEDRVDLVVNASNREADLEWVVRHVSPGLEVVDHSQTHVGWAIQGPASRDLMKALLPGLLDMKRREARVLDREGASFLVSRTGYTGEDGWEFFGPSSQGVDLYCAFLRSGKEKGTLVPCGLGARDLLRLEMGYPLYGQELSREVTPFDARLDFAVSRSKGFFIGREAILLPDGTPRVSSGHPVLVGFVLEGKGIPRTDCILENGHGVPVGKVTSGGYSPRVGAGFGLGFVDRAFAAAFQGGEKGSVRIHGSPHPISSRSWPFVKGGLLTQ